MSSPGADRRDFFISFNAADRSWAEWIAWELEAAGYTTFFQHWDFRPGSNFVLEMHQAASLADRTIAVLSPDYLNALFTQPEWAASLVEDPAGTRRKLVPVRVRPCEPDGLLRPLVYVDLVGLSEADARDHLIGAVAEVRPKPASVPFPADTPAKPFPGKPPAGNSSQHQPKAVPKPGRGRSAVLPLLGAVAVAGLLAAALVVRGGFSLPPSAPATFSTTVFVHGPAGPQDTVLRGKGNVVIDLHGNRRLEAINSKGAAHFPGIPVEFRGQEVPISIEAEGFECAEGGPRRLTGESLYLPVRRTPARLAGVVTDEQGEPVANAEVDVDGLLTQTDVHGRFALVIPSEQIKPGMTLRISAPHFQRQTLSVVPGGDEMQIRLERANLERKR